MAALRRFLHAWGAVAFAAASLTIGSPAGNAADAIRGSEWPLDADHFKADKVWAISRGAGVTVAVVDSGVAADHPDLAGQVLPGSSQLGDDGDGRADTSGDSHGTAIAGIIAGSGGPAPGDGMTGLAPDAKILPVRITTAGQASAQAVARGITWAADHGAKVINVSLGSPDPDPLLRQAVTYAMGKDAVLVASAGNEGDRGNPALYPAAFPGVVSVSGVDESGAFWKPSESGRGIVVAAPSAEIYSTNNQGKYVRADGTSYGAAYVSAAVALIRAAHPQLTSSQAIRRLITTTVERHTRPDPNIGYGRIDPLAALSAAEDGSRENPLLQQTADSPTGSHSMAIPVTAAVLLCLLAAAACAGAFFWWKHYPRRAGVSATGKSPSPSSAADRTPRQNSRRQKAQPKRRR